LRGDYLRKGFKTTIEENLIDELKIVAIKNKVDVNDILEILIKQFLDNKIQIDFNR